MIQESQTHALKGKAASNKVVFLKNYQSSVKGVAGARNHRELTLPPTVI